MPLEQALDVGAQMADALAKAHRHGIVHRDLKPGNIMLMKSGAGLQAKLLDFGLAKLRPQTGAPGSAQSAVPTRESATTPGAVMGTVPYMAPEQLEGKEVDARTDLFAFGCVLYEMLTGQRAFAGETGASIISAIMTSEPPPVSALQPVMPPVLDRLVRRCLAKDPDLRCDSAHDLADELRWVKETKGRTAESAAVPRVRRRALTAAVLVAIVAGTGGLAWYMRGRQQDAPTPPLSFKRMTYRRGWVSAARFAPDGHTVVYSAEWDGGPSEIFSRRIESPESQSLGHPSADLLAVAPTSELALSFDTHLRRDSLSPVGTLATVPFAAGEPRQLDTQISFADWSPDGKDIAVVRQTDKVDQLEFPRGKVLYTSGGRIYSPRVSPSGDRVAFIESPDESAGAVVVVDRQGKSAVLADKFNRGYPGCLAWAPAGDEVWFGVNRTGLMQELRAVTLTGRQRPLYSGPGFNTTTRRVEGGPGAGGP